VCLFLGFGLLFLFFWIHKDIFVLFQKKIRVIFDFLLVLGETSTFFGSLKGNIDTIGSLEEYINNWVVVWEDISNFSHFFFPKKNRGILGIPLRFNSKS
jgi:hypothetical protein